MCNSSVPATPSGTHPCGGAREAHAPGSLAAAGAASRGEGARCWGACWTWGEGSRGAPHGRYDPLRASPGKDGSQSGRSSSRGDGSAQEGKPLE